MFDHTFAAFNYILNGFKRMIFVIALVTQLVIIGHRGYSLYAGKGNLIANIVLIMLSTAYFVFFIVTRNMNSREEKNMKKITKRIFDYSKIFINAMTLGAVLYAAVISSLDMGAIDIILLALSLIGWIMQVVIQLIIHYVEAQVSLIRTAIEMDIEVVKRPVTVVSDAIKKITGKESTAVPTAQIKPKMRDKLDKLRDAYREERAAKKAEKKKKAILKKQKKQSAIAQADASVKDKKEEKPTANVN